MPQFRMKVMPDTVAYADRENHKLAWIPAEEECPNENASALPENPGIFLLPLSRSTKSLTRSILQFPQLP